MKFYDPATTIVDRGRAFDGLYALMPDADDDERFRHLAKAAEQDGVWDYREMHRAVRLFCKMAKEEGFWAWRDTPIIEATI